MGWREYVESVKRGGDDRDNRDDRPENTAIAPRPSLVPRVVADSLYREWVKALNAIDPDVPNRGFTEARWQRFHSASTWWVNSYGKQAARDGWGTGDVFGLRSGFERRGGLIDQLNGCRALMMEGGRARWRSYGVAFSYAAGAYPDLPAWWSA